MNVIPLELGFLQRLRASDLWPRAGWIFDPPRAGALSGAMALDRLDDPSSWWSSPPTSASFYNGYVAAGDQLAAFTIT